MKNLKDASKELMDDLIFALNHSMDLKRDGIDPMIPFAVMKKGSEQTIKSFISEHPEEADQMFEKTIKKEYPDIAIYVSDGYLTADNIKYDAVILKAYDKTDSEIYLVGQKFKPKSDTNDFEKIGNPGFLGTIQNYFASDSISSLENGNTNKKKPWWKF
jgi:hypothetical protein